MIGTLDIKTPVCTGTAVEDEQKIKDAEIISNNLSYTLQYEDGTKVKEGDTLNKGEIKYLVLKLNYDGNELPNGQQQLQMK